MTGDGLTHSNPEAPSKPTPGPDVTRLDVWLVEDHEELRATVREVIETDPEMTCSSSFATCEEALAALQKESPPQVVLMDIVLPGMNGIEGMRRIRSVSPATQVIMLTVYEDDDKVFESLCAGASGYLLKAGSTEKILQAIREVRAGGAPMSAHIAKRVLNLFTKMVRPQADYALTVREKEILQLLVSGLSQKMIADKLFVSPFTVGTHLKNIYAKLQVHSGTAAVAKALKENLL